MGKGRKLDLDTIRAFRQLEASIRVHVLGLAQVALVSRQQLKFPELSSNEAGRVIAAHLNHLEKSGAIRTLTSLVLNEPGLVIKSQGK